ncbi:MAG: PAS domain S-box protein [Opitutaceae bacterium]
MKRLLTLSSYLCLLSPVARAQSPSASGAADGWASLGVEIGVKILAGTAVIGMILYLRSLLKRRTSELHASEEQFRQLFQDAVEGIYENPPSGGFRLANPAMARILGYPNAESLINLPPGQVAACYVSPTRREEFFALLDSGVEQVKDFESEVLRPDGSWIWISENVRAVRDAEGRLQYVQGLVTDITARKHAELALRESEDRWRLAVLGINAGIWENNLVTGESFYSDRSKEILGFLPHELSSRREDWMPRIHPDDVHLGRQAMAEHVAGNRPYYHVEHRFRCKDGTYKWILSRGKALLNDAGEPVRVVGVHTDISESKHSERALRESEKRYRRLFLAHPYPMWIYDREGLRFLAVNDAAIAFYGYTREEFERMTLAEIRPADEVQYFEDKVRSMHQGANQLGIFTHLCKDGRVVRVEVTTLVFIDQGREQVLSMAKDLTEREQAQVALRESESRYRLLFENSPIEIIEYDYRSTMAWMEDLRRAGVADLAEWADTHAEEMKAAMSQLPIVGINAAALRLLGAQSVEEVMANMQRIVSLEGWALRRQSFLAAWAGRHESEGEMTLFGLDGVAHRVHSHWWVPIIDGQPYYERTPVALLDLTQTKAAELELASERERLTVTLSAMAEGVVTTDADGRVRFINKAACVITGWTSTASTDRSIEEVCALRHAKTGAVIPSPVAAALASGRVMDLPPQTTLLRRIGGRGLVEGCCAPIRDAEGKGTGAVLVLRDVTDRSRLEAELQRASKLEAVGILAGGIAHDFNNILAIVMGNLTLAQLDAGTSAAALKWLKEAERGAFRARDLTQQLLTFAKGGDPVRTAVELPEIVREAAKFALHGSTVRGEFEIADHLWAADVDGGQIGQVVQNLVINAMQAMKGGGSIRIMLRNEELAADAVPPLGAGRYLKLSLADAGPGIRPENLARIFEPYFTTKEQGSGLGLATVYSIIRKHHGHVTVESELGKGTTFHLWLPAARHAPVTSEPSRSPFSTLSGRLLFMDDEEPIRLMVDTLLSRLGLSVKTVADGAELVREYATARDRGQPYDLVMMDLTVPGAMGGKEAMQELLKLDPKVRAIVSSGYSGDPVMANFREHGFCGIVPKPYRVGDLTKVLEAALAGK